MIRNFRLLFIVAFFVNSLAEGRSISISGEEAPPPSQNHSGSDTKEMSGNGQDGECYPDISNAQFQEFTAKLNEKLESLKELSPDKVATEMSAEIDRLTTGYSNPKLKKSLIAFLLQKEIEAKQEKIKSMIAKIEEDTELKGSINSYNDAVQDSLDLAKMKNGTMPIDSESQMREDAFKSMGLDLQGAQDAAAKAKLDLAKSIREFFQKNATEFGIHNERDLTKLVVQVRQFYEGDYWKAHAEHQKYYDDGNKMAQMGQAASGVVLGLALTALGTVVAGPGAAALVAQMGLSGAIATGATISLTGAGYGVAFAAGSHTAKSLANGVIALASGKSFACELANQYDEKGVHELLTSTLVGGVLGAILGPFASLSRAATIGVTTLFTGLGTIGAAKVSAEAKMCLDSLQGLKSSLQMAYAHHANSQIDRLAGEIQTQSEECYKKVANAGIDLAALGIGVPAAIKTFKPGDQNYAQNRETFMKALEEVEGLLGKLFNGPKGNVPSNTAESSGLTPVYTRPPNEGISEPLSPGEVSGYRLSEQQKAANTKLVAKAKEDISLGRYENQQKIADTELSDTAPAEGHGYSNETQELYTATYKGKPVFIKGSHDPVEVRKLELLNSLGIDTGYLGMSGKGMVFKHYDGFLVKFGEGSGPGFTPGFDRSYKVGDHTYNEIRRIEDVLTQSGIEPHDLQFIVDRNGIPHLIDVGQYSFDAVNVPTRTRPFANAPLGFDPAQDPTTATGWLRGRGEALINMLKRAIRQNP